VGSSTKADSMDIFEFSDHHSSVDSDKVAEVVVVGSPKMENVVESINAPSVGNNVPLFDAATNESGVEVINVDLFPTQEEERYLFFLFLLVKKWNLQQKDCTCAILCLIMPIINLLPCGFKKL
jgi:hypothetical protein